MTTHLLYREVLGAEVNEAVFGLALGQRAHFERSRVSPRRVDPRTRSSSVIYDDRLRDVAPAIEAAVAARLDDALEQLGIAAFERGGYELQMTSHNDGEFFARHTDACSAATATRTLAFVYYFHRRPAGFSGGDVVFHHAGRDSDVVAPTNDSLLLFDPRTPHEVRPVCCPSGRFEDGRFTLNGWVHRRVSARPSTAFDQRIFQPVRGPARPSVDPTPAARRHAITGVVAQADDGARRLLALYGDLHRQGTEPNVIDRRPALDGPTFFAEYYVRNRPVVIPDLLADSPAVRTWSPHELARRFGNALVEITAGRDRHPDYEVGYRDTVRTTTMSDFVRRLDATDASNDFYLVARNQFFDRPPFHVLRDELQPPTDIVDMSDARYGAVKMWLGPQGTVTPLHFDEHNILLVQIYGRKRLKLVPSFDLHRMYVRDRYYSHVDPLDVDPVRYPLFAGASVIDVEIGPGDALLLPAGWWHWAQSCSVSISTTFSSFAIPQRNCRLARS